MVLRLSGYGPSCVYLAEARYTGRTILYVSYQFFCFLVSLFIYFFTISFSYLSLIRTTELRLLFGSRHVNVYFS